MLIPYGHSGIRSICDLPYELTLHIYHFVLADADKRETYRYLAGSKTWLRERASDFHEPNDALNFASTSRLIYRICRHGPYPRDHVTLRIDSVYTLLHTVDQSEPLTLKTPSASLLGALPLPLACMTRLRLELKGTMGPAFAQLIAGILALFDGGALLEELTIEFTRAPESTHGLSMKGLRDCMKYWKKLRCPFKIRFYAQAFQQDVEAMAQLALLTAGEGKRVMMMMNGSDMEM